MKKYDRQSLYDLNREQREAIFSELQRTARRRAATFRNKPELIESSILDKIDTVAFTQKKYSNTAYHELVRFLSSKTSTAANTESVNRRRRKKLLELGLDKETVDDKTFYDVLRGSTYKTLRGRKPSEEIFDAIEELLQTDYTKEEIERELESYMDKEMREPPTGVVLR